MAERPHPSRFASLAARVVVIWALLNAALAAILVFFTGESHTQQLALYWASVGVLLLTALVVAVFVRADRLVQPRPPVSPAAVAAPSAASGAPALAFALACLAGGMAWVWGTYLAYFAAAPLAFCLARWRAEWLERRGRR